MLVCESESESVSVSVLSLRWWQARIERLKSWETTSKAAGAAAAWGWMPQPKDPPPSPPLPVIEEVHEEDEDEEVDGAMDLARAAMAVGAMRAAGALKRKITIHTFRVRVLG